MKVICAGSRPSGGWPTRADVYMALEDWCEEFGAPSEVVSGACRGPDTWGEEWARDRGVRVVRMPADWNRYGKIAGPTRNEQMARYADALVAVWDGKSRGTCHIVRLMQQRGKPVLVRTMGAK